MGRREELEKQLKIAENRLRTASPDTPKEVLENYRKEYDSIDFELNNLYDDPETETE